MSSDERERERERERIGNVVVEDNAIEDEGLVEREVSEGKRGDDVKKGEKGR